MKTSRTEMPDWARQLRLQQLGLRRSPYGSPLALVKGLGALQAQEYESSLWALALRLRPQPGESRRTRVIQALTAGEIVRTWPMRGTLHWVPGTELSWMLALMTPRILSASAGRLKELEITPALLKQTGQCLSELLADAPWLSRPEILGAFEKVGIATQGQRGYHLLGWHAQTGLICQGPPLGKQPSFALLASFCPPQTQLSPEAALAEITRIYFSGHGPATLQDLARWTGLPLTQARQGLAAVSHELASETWDGKTHWFSADISEKTAVEPDSKPEVVVLPAFDEYLIGYQDRDAVLDPVFADQVVPGKNGIFQPIFVINGEVRGVWKRQIKRSTVAIQVMPFGPLSKPESEALMMALEDFAAYLGLLAQIDFQAP